MIQVRYFSCLSLVNLIDFYYIIVPATTPVFFLVVVCNIVHVTVLNASSNGKLLLSSLTVRRRTWRHKSQIKSVKIYLGLRGFSNNGLNFSCNCLVTSNRIFPWISSITGII